MKRRLDSNVPSGTQVAGFISNGRSHICERSPPPSTARLTLYDLFFGGREHIAMDRHCLFEPALSPLRDRGCEIVYYRPQKIGRGQAMPASANHDL